MVSPKHWIDVDISEPAHRAIQTWPPEIKKDIQALFSISPSKSPFRAREIRLKDKSGVCRTLYVIQIPHGLIVFHAFAKKTPQASKQRFKAFLRELGHELGKV